jgi:hypothetical protein
VGDAAQFRLDRGDRLGGRLFGGDGAVGGSLFGRQSTVGRGLFGCGGALAHRLAGVAGTLVHRLAGGGGPLADRFGAASEFIDHVTRLQAPAEEGCENRGGHHKPQIAGLSK